LTKEDNASPDWDLSYDSCEGALQSSNAKAVGFGASRPSDPQACAAEANARPIGELPKSEITKELHSA
jgi:hypothetical protein